MTGEASDGTLTLNLSPASLAAGRHFSTVTLTVGGQTHKVGVHFVVQ